MSAMQPGYISQAVGVEIRSGDNDCIHALSMFIGSQPASEKLMLSYCTLLISWSYDFRFGLLPMRLRLLIATSSYLELRLSQMSHRSYDLVGFFHRHIESRHVYEV